jgi:RNA polymerase sigma-70 factor
MNESLPLHEDLELARRCLASEPSALREFTRRYRPVAAAAVGTVGFFGQDVDDIVQRLFIRLLLANEDRPPKLASYGGAGSLRGWLRMCAVREALMARRAERSRAERPGEWTMIEDPAPQPDRAAVQSDAESVLQGAFGQVVADLEPRERNLLRYSAYAGANQEQVAKSYGVHRATVSRWYDRLRVKLRKRTLQRLACSAAGTGRSAPTELLPSRLDMRLSQVLRRRMEPEA